MIRLIHPISEEKRRELERELERQKRRFWDATQTSAQKVQNILSLESWVRKYPLSSAMVLATLGFVVGHLIRTQQAHKKDYAFGEKSESLRP